MSERAAPRPDNLTATIQRESADPRNSAWVSANAGSGKTYVLTTRVIRLLLDGVDPGRILCLTYTKTAAAQMKNKVFARLGDWVTMSDATLADTITDLTGKRANATTVARARTLFARALETPGGLKIQTIHAFCEALLHRFPLEANVPGHFDMADDQTVAALRQQAFSALVKDRGPAGAAVERLVMDRGEQTFTKFCDSVVAERLYWRSFFESPQSEPAACESAYRHRLGLPATATLEDLQRALLPLVGLSERECRDLLALIPTGEAKIAVAFLTRVVKAYEAETPDNVQICVEDVFLDGKQNPRGFGNVASKAILAVAPDFASTLERAKQSFEAARDRILAFNEMMASLDLVAIARFLVSRYDQLKQTHGLLDFDDLIDGADRLLNRQDMSAWVRFKLDQGIDHVLVDEAQDTSPAQWRVIAAITDEFFAGEGARDEHRTVFAVGDEKQSIYSFQGADPDEFDKHRRYFENKAKAAGKPFLGRELTASFRSSQAVLAAVDLVFAADDPARGVRRESARAITHIALRDDDPGLVEVWDRFAPGDADEPDDWITPVDAATQPTRKLAHAIADRVASWLEKKTALPGTDRPVSAGDILILLRRRDVFMLEMLKALKDRHVPVAGTDRLAMTDHIAIKDLMALGRIALNRRDDLSLAALLRSPLFDLSEEDLFDLAHERGAQSLFERLLAAPAFADHSSRLQRWCAMARSLPVFDFYARVLSVDGGRKAFLSRLGPEAGDMLDEFLNFALAQERGTALTLEAFLDVLEHSAPEIKREMEQDSAEVRIMTVHGAKGLEAPIVFLVDPGSAGHRTNNNPEVVHLPAPAGSNSPTSLPLLRGSSGAIQSSAAREQLDLFKQRQEEEYRRLLYVGMTRAADWLFVCGYTGKQPVDPTWITMVRDALADKAKPFEEPFAHWRFPAGHGEAPAATRIPEKEAGETNIPPCFAEKAPEEPPPLRPLIPSGVSGFAIADESAPQSSAFRSLLAETDAPGTSGDPALAIRRGNAIHTLLQMLPTLDPAVRRMAAGRYLDHKEPEWSGVLRDQIIAQVFTILDNDAYADIFAPGSLAEVPVMGRINVKGEERGVSGIIDRLSITDTRVRIIDYKTGSRIPRTSSDVDPVYLRQMALYRALVAPLWPTRKIETALLFTAAPAMVVLDEDDLDRALAEITQN